MFGMETLWKLFGNALETLIQEAQGKCYDQMGTALEQRSRAKKRDAEELHRSDEHSLGKAWEVLGQYLGSALKLWCSAVRRNSLD